jgi:hypothetical protein
MSQLPHCYTPLVPFKRKLFFFFFSILSVVFRISCGLCEFGLIMHLYSYYRDSHLCQCREPLPLTPGTLIHAHTLHLCPYSKDPCLCSCHEPLPFTSRTFIHARTLHLCSYSKGLCPCQRYSTIPHTTIGFDTTC